MGTDKPLEECSTPVDSPYDSGIDDSGSASEQDDVPTEQNNGGPQIDALRALLERQRSDLLSLDSPLDAPKVQMANSELDFPTMKAQTPEMSQLSQEIHDLINHLYKLAMMIRRPAPHDRFSKCESIDVSHFDAFDFGNIKSCFPVASDVLCRRLAQAQRRRRQFLIYNERHHDALARPKKMQAHQETPVEVRTDSPYPRNNITSDPPSVVQQPENPQGTGASSSHFGTEATQFVAPDNYEDDEVQSDAGTMTSHASTAGSDDRIHIPPRPRGPDGKELEQFECPYCFHIVAIKTQKKWKMHVFRDLRPYVCTFDQCTSPDLAFEKSSEWYSHEVQFHRKDWNCNVLGHETYQNEEQFKAHLRQTHPSWFVESQLPSLLKLFGRPSQAPLSECPFCADHYQEFEDVELRLPRLTDEDEPVIRLDRVFVEAGKLKRHIARHLERLALFAVPNSNYNAAEAGSLRSDYVDPSSRGSRSTLSESEPDSTSLPKSPTGPGNVYY